MNIILWAISIIVALPAFLGICACVVAGRISEMERRVEYEKWRKEVLK